MKVFGAGWARRWGTGLVVIGVTLSGMVGISSAQAVGSYQLVVSSSADRSAATPLDGATVSGNIYAFTSPDTGVKKSVFYIDDPTASGVAFHSESTGPYDFNGGSPAAAAPYDTHALSDGQHTITQVVTTTANIVETDVATITVNNSIVLPPVPTSVSTLSGNGFVDLSWASASGSTVGFNVYRGTSAAVSLSGTPLNGSSLITAAPYHDATVTNGTTYFYVVQSVDGGGRHNEAAAVQGKPVAPPATPPYVLQMSTSTDRSAPTSLDGATVSGSIYVFTGPATAVKRADFWLDNTSMTGSPNHSETTGPFDFIGGSPAAATPWVTSALANGQHTITQQVTTTSNVVYVFTATFTISNVVVPPPPPPPPAPTTVKATGGNGFVDVTWDPASGSTVGFNIYRATATPVSITATPLNGTTLITGSSYHDATVTNGTFFYYVVQSVDSIGQHTQAASVSAKPTAPPVGPVFTVTVSTASDRSAGHDLNNAVVSGDAYIYTSPATAVKTVQFWLDDTAMAGPVTRNEATAPYDFIGGSPAAATPYDTHVLADGTHTITQKVTTTSNVVVITTATFKVVNSALPPPTPTNAAATAGDGYVDLTWDARVGTTVGFNLYRGTSPAVNLGGTPLNGATLLTGTAFHDASVTDGTTYYYVLQSVDSIGRHSEADAVPATPNVPGPQRIAVTPTPIVFSTASGTSSSTLAAKVTNVGGQNLTVTGASLGGGDLSSFQVVSAPSYPAVLAPGASTSITLRFVPGSTGTKGTTLTVTSNDSTTPTTTVPVRGLALSSPTSEPSLQQIFDTYQIPISTGDPNPGDIYLPLTAPLGDESGVQGFVKAGAGPITVTPLAIYDGQNVDPTVRLGWTPVAQALPRSQVLAVPGAQNRTLQVQATGVGSFDPGSTAVSLYAAFPGRVSYQDDTLNAGVPGSLPRQVRVYPFRTPAGVTVANSWVVAFEDFVGAPASNTSGEWNDAVVLVTNAKAETLISRNLDGGPFNDRLVMSRIGSNPGPSASWASHDTGTVRFTNTSTTPRAITSAVVSGPFQLIAPTSFPLTVPAGGTADVTVQFIALRAPKGQTGSLVITTDDGVRATRSFALGGLWEPAAGGENEPSVATILETAFGFGTVITKPGQSINTRGQVLAVGDEVLSKFWKRADTSLPVSVRQIAGYAGGNPSFSWYSQTQGCRQPNVTCATAITQNAVDGQSVYPRRMTGGQLTTSAATFTPADTFGVQVDGDYSDDTRNSLGSDRNWGCTAAMACGHHVRFWPAKDENGKVIPNAYLVARDTYGSSMDYNDEVFLFTNVTPA